METKYIDVDGQWGVIICYDYDIFDWDDMRAVMRTFGMREDNVREAIRVLSRYNTGMCISRDDIRMSCLFISDATSPDQWWDTCAHELLDHAKEDIKAYYDVPARSEGSAWLTGFLMRRMVQLFGVPCKRE
jgi:hypothetical protein